MVGRNKIIANTLFFISIYLYFSTLGKYILLYQENHSLFLFTQSYFTNFLRFPGGISEYLSAFLTQFSFYPIIGACIVASVFTLIAFLTQKVFRTTPQFFWLFHYLPALVLLIFYTTPEFGLTIPIAFAINLLVLFIYHNISKTSIRYTFGFVALLLLYTFTAAIFYSFLLAAVFMEILQSNIKQKYFFIPLYTLAALLLPLLAGQYIYCILPVNSYFRLLGDSFADMPRLFFVFLLSYISLPLMALVLHNKEISLPVFLQKNWLKPFPLILILVVTNVILYQRYEKKVSQMICTANAAYSENWDELLHIASEYKGTNYLMAYYTNLALLNSGSINSDLLQYNQELGTQGLFFTWDRSRKKSEHGGLLYYHLGFINEAHHWAFESLVSNGENAEQLKMLALTNLINGKRALAEKYLNKLSNSLFYAFWAGEYLPLARDEELWMKDEYIQQKREQMPKSDFFMNLNDLGPDLVQMLQSNPENQAAFEYLLSYYLLTNQVDMFARTLKRFAKKEWIISPIHQQAMLVYLSANPEDSEAYDRFKIEQSSKSLFTEYVNAMRTLRPKRGNIPTDFKADFGGTYWYYVHFVSPYGNKVVKAEI